jgi:redox-sensitive bicupin YhaK (pirin superfamily)
VQVITGNLDVNGETLQAGDAAQISEETALRLTGGKEPVDFLLFDLN